MLARRVADARDRVRRRGAGVSRPRSCRRVTTRGPTTASRSSAPTAASSPTRSKPRSKPSSSSSSPRPGTGAPTPTVRTSRRSQPTPPSADAYVDASPLARSTVATLDGLDVVLDCANGAGFEFGPRVLRAAGARVHVLHADPDGHNINDGCGSTYPESLQRAVVGAGRRARARARRRRRPRARGRRARRARRRRPDHDDGRARPARARARCATTRSRSP